MCKTGMAHFLVVHNVPCFLEVNYDKIGLQQVSSSQKLTICYFGNGLLLSRRGPWPLGHAHLNPEKHEKCNYLC